MSFTYADMKRLYAEHGDQLVWLNGRGGAFSANPADYWSITDDEVIEGRLAVQITETYEEVH